MPDPFDAYQYFSFLRARWRLPALALGAALAVSLALSLLLPSKYTAKVSLVIEPPAGADPRASTAVSPIYLESLRTYEHFASSDHLFGQAVERFQLRAGNASRPMERLKREVLRVSVPRNTKILEIAATLNDPKKAHAVAAYIAGETIQLNRKTNRAGDEEMIEQARRQAEEAARRLEAAGSARQQFQKRAPTIETLRSELEQLRGLREEIDRLALSAELTIAEQEGLAESRVKLQQARTRSESLRRRAADLDRQISAKQTTLAARAGENDSLEAAYESAWAIQEEVQRRLRDMQSVTGHRGERLNLLDPGLPPERPSFPNLPLNLLVAAALGLIGSLVYVTLEFSLQSLKSESLRKNFRVPGKS